MSIETLVTKLEKGGEGSRGGKVIGHTKSGKPIYAKAKNKNHNDFTHEDHADAAKLHGNSTDPDHQSWHHKLLSTKDGLDHYKHRKKVLKEKRDAKKKVKDIQSQISALKQLRKGGAGSGKKGHTTNNVLSLTDKLKGNLPKPMTKLDEHLNKLTNGTVLENSETKSGKPVFSGMDHAAAHAYTPDDHNDAMNVHYDVAQKWATKIDQLKQAGHKIPKSAEKIKDFHNQKFKEHFRTGQKLAARQAKTEELVSGKKKEVKKSVTQMGHHESGDLNTGDFATSYVNALDNTNWLEQLYGLMDGFDYGDTPRELMLDKGMLSLVKVDDGQYTGYFKHTENGMEDNAKIRIERITLPELVQLLLAKEYITPVVNEMAEPVETRFITKLDLEEFSDVKSVIPNPIEDNSKPDRKLEMLRLISKLLS